MLKYGVVIVLALCYMQFALGLKCYVTDVKRTKPFSYAGLTPHPQDCDEYIKNMMLAHGVPVRKVRPNILFRCFNVTVKTDFSEVWVKGCIPAGRCESLQQTVKNELEIHLDAPINSVVCTECATDKCNA